MVEIYDKSQNEGVGVAILNGKFIGPPLVRKANSVIGRYSKLEAKNK